MIGRVVLDELLGDAQWDDCSGDPVTQRPVMVLREHLEVPVRAAGLRVCAGAHQSVQAAFRRVLECMFDSADEGVIPGSIWRPRVIDVPAVDIIPSHATPCAPAANPQVTALPDDFGGALRATRSSPETRLTN